MNPKNCSICETRPAEWHEGPKIKGVVSFHRIADIGINPEDSGFCLNIGMGSLRCNNCALIEQLSGLVLLVITEPESKKWTEI